MELWTAFSIGLLGSLHCVGMCGPIALALPYTAESRWQTVLNILLYNFGRVTTYAALGSILGLLGKGLFIVGLQQKISILTGILLLITVFFSINIERQLLKIPFLNRFTNGIQRQLGRLLKRASASPSVLYAIGVLNGFLPCGLVYMAIAGAMTTTSVLQGGLYMMLFGIGTIPLMLSTALFGNFLSLQFRRKMRYWLPTMLVIFATLFVLRGMNLGIPYLSPKVENHTGANGTPTCH